MPLHNVDEAFDQSFWDGIVVVRRYQTVSPSGRLMVQSQSFPTVAVITAVAPDDLQRLPEADMFAKSIQIYTPTRLQGDTRDAFGNVTLPDNILWHNNTYIVRLLDDFSGYGQGWISAIAVMVEAIPAPIPDPVGSA